MLSFPLRLFQLRRPQFTPGLSPFLRHAHIFFFPLFLGWDFRRSSRYFLTPPRLCGDAQLARNTPPLTPAGPIKSIFFFFFFPRYWFEVFTPELLVGVFFFLAFRCSNSLLWSIIVLSVPLLPRLWQGRSFSLPPYL